MFTICAIAYLVIALVIAVMTATANVAVLVRHGWWLVAYLGLVGGVAQLMLGPGLRAIASRSDAITHRHDRHAAELLLWNGGTITVAFADLAAQPTGVLVGSVLLVVALVLFAAELRGINTIARRPERRWTRLYALLLVFLGASVVVGTVLAYRAHV